MNWDDLRLFLAVARGGRLAVAGKAVGQDATTVGRRMQRLEQALGATLFEQTPTGHQLTPRGNLLLKGAELMESAAIGIQASSDVATGALAGTIRVSVSEGFGTAVVSRKLAGFLADHPRLAVELIASSGFLNPSRREADIAVMLARPKAGPLITRKLTNYHLGLYAHPDYLASAQPIAVRADLLKHRLVGYVPDQIYAPELRYLEEVHPRLEASVRSSSINAQAGLIQSGAGCGILPCFIGDELPGLVRLLREEVDIVRSFWLVTHRDARKILRIEYFIAWLLTTVELLKPELAGRVAD